MIYCNNLVCGFVSSLSEFTAQLMNHIYKKSVYKDSLQDFLQKEAHLHLKFRNCVFIPLALLHVQQLPMTTKTPHHSAPLLLESTNGSWLSVSTVGRCSRGKSSLGFSFHFQEQKGPWGGGVNQGLYCKWYHSSFLQGAKLEYNDYTEEHLRERGWSNLREMKTESSSWYLVLHYSPWDRRHKYSKLPVRCLFFLEQMTSKILAVHEMNERFSLSVFRELSNNLHTPLYSNTLVNIYRTMQ